MRNATTTPSARRILKAPQEKPLPPVTEWVGEMEKEITEGVFDDHIPRLLQALNNRMYMTTGRSFPLPVQAPPPKPVVAEPTTPTWGHFYRWDQAPRKLRQYVFEAQSRGKGGSWHLRKIATNTNWLPSAEATEYVVPAVQVPFLKEVWPEACGGTSMRSCANNYIVVHTSKPDGTEAPYTCYVCGEAKANEIAGATPSAVFVDEIAQMEEGSFGTRPVKVGKPEEKYGDKIKVPAKAVCVHPVVRLGKCIICNNPVRVAMKPAKIARRQS